MLLGMSRGNPETKTREEEDMAERPAKYHHGSGKGPSQSQNSQWKQEKTGKAKQASYWSHWNKHSWKSSKDTQKNQEEVTELKEMVKLLTKIALKHEDEMVRGRLDTGFMIYADTGSHGLTNLRWLMAQNWREMKEQGKVQTSLRVTLFLALLQALQEKLGEFASQEKAVKRRETRMADHRGSALGSSVALSHLEPGGDKVSIKGGPHPAQQDHDGHQHLEGECSKGEYADEVSFDTASMEKLEGPEPEPSKRCSIDGGLRGFEGGSEMAPGEADSASGTSLGADLQELKLLQLGPGAEKQSYGIRTGERERKGGEYEIGQGWNFLPSKLRMPGMILNSAGNLCYVIT